MRKTYFSSLCALVWTAGSLAVAAEGGAPGQAKPATRPEAGPPMAAVAQLSRNSIWVGDVFDYSVKILVEPLVRVDQESLKINRGATLGPFTVLQTTIQERTLPQGRRELFLVYRLTCYDLLGNQGSIPPLVVPYFIEDPKRPAEEFSRLEWVVPEQAVGFRRTLEKDARRATIRDTPQLQAPARRPWLVWIASAGLAVVLYPAGRLAFRWYRRRSKARVGTRTRREEVAQLYRDFSQLKKMAADSNGDNAGKAYELATVILHRYLDLKYDLSSSALTPGEVEQELKSKPVDPDRAVKVREVLATCVEHRYGANAEPEPLVGLMDAMEEILRARPESP
ncbi:MAG: hypothetical protein HY652_08115 [Acidobacteria bacterium]|nr:hypothetical protein [Acidobacteriota bacterium]